MADTSPSIQSQKLPAFRHRAAVAHRVRARMARCSTRALCGGESASTGRATGIGRMLMPFRQHREVLSKSPTPAHELAGHGEGMDARVEATQEQLPDARQAPSGGRFLLVTSLLLRASCPSPFGPASLFAHASCVHVDKQKRSNLAAAGRRKLLALKLSRAAGSREHHPRVQPPAHAGRKARHRRRVCGKRCGMCERQSAAPGTTPQRKGRRAAPPYAASTASSIR